MADPRAPGDPGPGWKDRAAESCSAPRVNSRSKHQHRHVRPMSATEMRNIARVAQACSTSRGTDRGRGWPPASRAGSPDRADRAYLAMAFALLNPSVTAVPRRLVSAWARVMQRVSMIMRALMVSGESSNSTLRRPSRWGLVPLERPLVAGGLVGHQLPEVLAGDRHGHPSLSSPPTTPARSAHPRPRSRGQPCRRAADAGVNRWLAATRRFIPLSGAAEV